VTTSDGDLPVGETVDIEQALHEVTGEACAPDAVLGGTAATGTAVANGTRPTLLDGAEPPFDIEAT